MAEIDHRKEAQGFAQLALSGDYVNEEYPQRLAAIAQAHAILAVAHAISELTGLMADRFSE